MIQTIVSIQRAGRSHGSHCIHDALGSNVDWDTDRRSFCSPYRQMPEYYLNKATMGSLQTLFNLFFSVILPFDDINMQSGTESVVKYTKQN
jgi:hypothetical protein